MWFKRVSELVEWRTLGYFVYIWSSLMVWRKQEPSRFSCWCLPPCGPTYIVLFCLTEFWWHIYANNVIIGVDNRVSHVGHSTIIVANAGLHWVWKHCFRKMNLKILSEMSAVVSGRYVVGGCPIRLLKSTLPCFKLGIYTWNDTSLREVNLYIITWGCHLCGAIS